MSTKYVIHIGAPKCGSTYLQTLLRDNESLLAENDWVLPGLDQKHPGTSLGILESYKDVLNDAIVCNKSAVVSHEGLFGSALKAKAMLEYARSNFDEVVVIAFVRPIEDIVFSSYSQLLKTSYKEHWMQDGSSLTGFDDFARQYKEKPGMDLALNRWSKLTDNINIQVHQHTTIRDVFKEILQLDLADRVKLSKANKSFRVCDCEETVARLQNDKLSWEEAIKIWKRNARSAEKPDAGKTKLRKSEIRNSMHKTIISINRKFSVKV